MVRSTWALIHDAETLASQLTKAAAKIGKPKSNGLGEIWDLPCLHAYLWKTKIDDLDFKGLTENVVLKLKGYTGWRSDDLTGLYVTNSFNWVGASENSPPGVYIKHFDPKAKKGKWSASVYIPRLSDKYQTLCLYRALKLLCSRLSGCSVPLTSDIVDSQGASCKDQPLLCWMKNKQPQPLASSTVANYFKKAFLEKVTGPKGKLSESFNPHSSRNAVASALHDMGVPTAQIAALTQNTAATLDSTYIRLVLREWDLPLDCIRAQPRLCAKLLLPFVHHTSKAAGGDTCDCSTLLS